MEAVVASFTQMDQITAALEKAVEFKENKLERALEQFGARFECVRDIVGNILWESLFYCSKRSLGRACSGGDNGGAKLWLGRATRWLCRSL